MFASGLDAEAEWLRAQLRRLGRQAARAVMVLLSLHELPAAQIAELLECRPATVRRCGHYDRASGSYSGKRGRGSMGRSARLLGWEFGGSARDMNALLKEHGYLDGETGAYGLTEKGKKYAEEQYHDNGYGGYAYRGWETRTWNDETAATLKADMEASSGGSVAEEALPEDLDFQEYDPLVDYSDSDHDDEPQFSWQAYAIGGAVVGGMLLAPHVKPFWTNKVKPAAKRYGQVFEAGVSSGRDARFCGEPRVAEGVLG